MLSLLKLLSIKTDTCNFQQVVSVRFESQISLYIGLNQAFQRFTPALCRNHCLALTARLPNVKTLQPLHRAGHWTACICVWSCTGIPKLLPGP